MNRHRPAVTVQLALFALPLVAIGCRPAGGPGPPGRDHPASKSLSVFDGQYPARVVCTIGPITDMLQALGGDRLEVSGLMGPGVDPHLYRAVPSDIEDLEAADLIVYNGLHLEGRMAELFEKMADRKPVIAVTDGLVSSHDKRLLQPAEFAGHYDPHVWHDAALWADCTRFVADRLAEFDPANKESYRQASEAYRRELMELDAYCRQQIATLPAKRRVLVTAHDAFGYFSRAYGLKTEALKGISTEDEVDIGRMDELIDMLVEDRIPAVFVESAVAPKIVQALIEPCRAAGHDVRIGGELYADALGPVGSGADSYVGMLRANVDTLVAALAAPHTSPPAAAADGSSTSSSPSRRDLSGPQIATGD